MTLLVLAALALAVERALCVFGRRASRAAPRSKRPASGASASPPIRSTRGGPQASQSARLTPAELAAREALPVPGRRRRARGLPPPRAARGSSRAAGASRDNPTARYRLRAAGRQSGARRGGGLRVRRGCRPEDRSRGPETARSHADVSRGAAGRRSAADRGPRGRRRRLGGHRRGDEPARAPQPPVQVVTAPSARFRINIAMGSAAYPPQRRPIPARSR